jgi:hypothetical protein
MEQRYSTNKNTKDKKRLLRVLITPAQNDFLRSMTEKAAMNESEVVRTALNRMMHDQFGIKVPV